MSIAIVEPGSRGDVEPYLALGKGLKQAGYSVAGLRAGVPSIVIPFFGDQPFWGQRVADLGVGAAPIPRKQLTVDKLAAAIDRVITDRSIQQRAAALGAKIQAEDGIGNVVAIVKKIERDLS